MTSNQAPDEEGDTLQAITQRVIHTLRTFRSGYSKPIFFAQ